jgi:hypothetical protein
MPVKIARLAARPSFELPEPLIAIHTSRQSYSKAGKARIFALSWESSRESRVIELAPFKGSHLQLRQLAVFPGDHSGKLNHH